MRVDISREQCLRDFFPGCILFSVNNAKVYVTPEYALFA